ncbi:MAG: response regulator transcription factor [Chloroflexota bacterium]|nr:response regulator transcription factor [Chloroflexota bacterium]
MKTNQPHQDNSQATILVVDDERTLLDLLEYNLQREGYRVLTASNGNAAVDLAYAEEPDLLILDIMLPGMSGFDVCRMVRKRLTVPILMLSAREDEIDKVLGLELGADDYMTKPFGLRELLARVRAMLRRSEIGQLDQPAPVAASAFAASPTSPHALDQQLPAGGLVIDLAQHTVTRDGKRVEMKPKEFDLLAFLAAHPLQVFQRDVLLDRVWGYDYAGGTRTVDVHVRWLRSKLERDPGKPELIQTVFGVGYKLGQAVELRQPAPF